MEKRTIKRFSLLGIVLIAASAVTAAVLPSKSKADNDKFAAGSVTASSTINGAKETCTPTDDGATERACTATTGTRSTGDVPASATVGNTSVTTP